MEYNIVLMEKPLDEGCSKDEYVAMLDLLSGPEAIPLDVEGECSAAMGFINLLDAEWMDFELDPLKKFIKTILDDVDAESPDGTYEFPNRNGVSSILLTRTI